MSADESPPIAVVSGLATLKALAAEVDGPVWLMAPLEPPPASFISIRIRDLILLVSDRDKLSSRCVVMKLDEGSLLGKQAKAREYEPVLERIVHFAERARSMKLQLPYNWNLWQSGDRYAFAAATYRQNPRNLRCVAQIEQLERSVLIWHFYRRDKPIAIETLEIDESLLRRASRCWHQAFAGGRSRFGSDREKPEQRRQVELDHPGESAASAWSYEQWIPVLTDQQTEFLVNDVSHNLYLRGPAGSGKTLTLELKALREVYRCRELGSESRILFATHSWASADQVDRDLQQLDTAEGKPSIDVLPLSALAESVTPVGAWKPDGMELLGDDSYTSKTLQIEMIGEIVDSFAATDWATYRESVSPALRERMENHEASARRELLDDFLTEFGCVLAAENIFRSRDAEQRYLDLKRGSWMMPLETEVDRRMAFRLYQQYLMKLRASSYVTTDLLMSEFFRFLQGNVWDIQRAREGYDLVLVDEVHLFNVQEKMALWSLMRDPMDQLRVCAAVDLRQSPRVRVQAPAEQDPEAKSIILTSVHRYSPEILDVVRHIHDSYPALDLPPAWNLDIDRVQSTADSGPRPVLHVISGWRDAAMTSCLARANALRAGGEETAVLVLDERYFREYEEFARRSSDRVNLISGRDDLQSLNHRKRPLVVGLAEHVAGLQFETVLVVDVSEGLTSGEWPAYKRRDAFTALYLAVSRAKRRLEFFVDVETGTPTVLATAVTQGLIVPANS